MSEEAVSLRLSKSEALVLFEVLCRFGEVGRLEVWDAAEERALWNLQALLEGELAEPFSPDYRKALGAAKSRLLDD